MIEDITNGQQPQPEKHEPLLWQKVKQQKQKMAPSSSR
jgi:hypothetical protein